MKRVLTPEMEQYFIKNAFKESVKDMSKKFGVSDSVVKGVFKRHSIVVPKEIWMQFKIAAQKGRTSFTNDETAFIKDNYLTIPIKTMANILQRSSCGIKIRMKQLGLKVPQELADKRKQQGMFRKGHEPVNKGKKQVDYMSADAIERTKVTRFKKGQKPPNSYSDFTEVLRNDKNGRKYWLIRLPNKSKLYYKHIWLWETHNNKKLEPGYNIVFKDGNTQNCVIENLEYITDAELMQRNTFHRYPQELKELIHIKAAVTRQINKHKKQDHDRTIKK